MKYLIIKKTFDASFSSLSDFLDVSTKNDGRPNRLTIKLTSFMHQTWTTRFVTTSTSPMLRTVITYFENKEENVNGNSVNFCQRQEIEEVVVCIC